MDFAYFLGTLPFWSDIVNIYNSRFGDKIFYI